MCVSGLDVDVVSGFGLNWVALTLPPPAHREGTCCGSAAADTVLDPVQMAGQAAQWHCTDRSSRTGRKLPAVMDRASLQIRMRITRL